MADPPSRGDAAGDSRDERRQSHRSSRPRRRSGNRHAWQRFRLPRAPQPAQIERQIARMLIAVLRVFCQGLVENLVQLRRLLGERRPRIVNDCRASCRPATYRGTASVPRSFRGSRCLTRKCPCDGRAAAPLACSGDMYAAVPSTVPAALSAVCCVTVSSAAGVRSISLARPKSRIFT